MKYYLVIVQNNQTQAVFAHTGIDQALAAFHNELAYRAESRTSTLCVIIDEYGNTVKREYWSPAAEQEGEH